MTGFTYSSVDCQEVFGSAVETCDIFSGFSASVRLRCAWSDRQALIDDLLSTPRAWPKSSGLTPYCVHASAVAEEMVYTQNGQGISYNEKAVVTAEYNTTIIDVASESIEPCIEAIPLPFTRFNWTGQGGALLQEGEAPPLILRSLNLVRTRYRLAAIPTDILAATGCVNNADYVSDVLGGLVFPAETLLFLPADVQRSFTNFTSNGYTLTLKFSYKQQGWNKYWRAATAGWESIYLNNASSRYLSYPLYDFSPFFS